MASSFTCPVCGMTSHNPNDAKEGYCGNCHDWTLPTETPTLVCSPSNLVPLANCVARMGDCGHEVWVSPSGLAKIAKMPGILISCFNCIPAGADVQLGIVPGALREIEENLGPDKRRQIQASLRRYGFRGA